jgi:hypothetical protein
MEVLGVGFWDRAKCAHFPIFLSPPNSVLAGPPDEKKWSERIVYVTRECGCAKFAMYLAKFGEENARSKE